MSNVRVFSTDGFRYLAFEPPIEKEVANNIPKPVMGFVGGEHEWEPSGQGIQKSKGLVIFTGWMSEAFGSNEAFMRHAEKVAEHIGGSVLNPNYFG